ncbi:hypothetical protein CDV55_104916 [Aspergillus turcosus]|uniref:Uncharacterized protein n=1 Tax=Aspergillus turcosus TaxID=1245748 RepID=A0A229XNF7_9EURO|nr:hypothetical protein CDV55_104916 [Aspergillus turcosus]RLL99698.1 hypothetical protein CFD26_103487 [Aspergillus turcosus]
MWPTTGLITDVRGGGAQAAAPPAGPPALVQGPSRAAPSEHCYRCLQAAALRGCDEVPFCTGYDANGIKYIYNTARKQRREQGLIVAHHAANVCPTKRRIDWMFINMKSCLWQVLIHREKAIVWTMFPAEQAYIGAALVEANIDAKVFHASLGFSERAFPGLPGFRCAPVLRARLCVCFPFLVLAQLLIMLLLKFPAVSLPEAQSVVAIDCVCEAAHPRNSALE